jgi:3-oxoacyl-[acyl-carrier protein] reductase
MALAKELAPSRIPVNAIACGCVDTRMNGHLSVQEKQALAEEIPAGRFAKPSEIADSVRLLLRAPAYLTGQVLTVDGGWI